MADLKSRAKAKNGGKSGGKLRQMASQKAKARSSKGEDSFNINEEPTEPTPNVASPTAFNSPPPPPPPLEYLRHIATIPSLRARTTS